MFKLKQTLRQNTLRLLAADGPLKSNETGVRRLVEKGIGQGTAQRILDSKTSTGLDTLEQLADALGVSPWRLIQPMQSSANHQVAATKKQPPELTTSDIEILKMLNLLSDAERSAIRTVLKRMVARDAA